MNPVLVSRVPDAEETPAVALLILPVLLLSPVRIGNWVYLAMLGCRIGSKSEIPQYVEVFDSMFWSGPIQREGQVLKFQSVSGSYVQIPYWDPVINMKTDKSGSESKYLHCLREFSLSASPSLICLTTAQTFHPTVHLYPWRGLFFIVKFPRHLLLFCGNSWNHNANCTLTVFSSVRRWQKQIFSIDTLFYMSPC